VKPTLIREHLIYPAASHVDPLGGRIDGLAPMVTCVLWIAPDDYSELFKLYGAERSTVTMQARGVVHAVKEINARAGKQAIGCVTPSDGLWLQTCHAEVAARPIDGQDVFEEVVAMIKAKDLRRRQRNHRDAIPINQAIRKTTLYRADLEAHFMADPRRYTRPGITWTGCEQVNVSMGGAPLADYIFQ
jgi:hypothetical protein